MANVQELLTQNDELMHYGTPRHSGRYPWGSGDRPHQHDRAAKKIERMKAHEERIAAKDQKVLDKKNKAMAGVDAKQQEIDDKFDKKMKDIDDKVVVDMEKLLGEQGIKFKINKDGTVHLSAEHDAQLRDKLDTDPAFRKKYKKIIDKALNKAEKVRKEALSSTFMNEIERDKVNEMPETRKERNKQIAKKVGTAAAIGAFDTAVIAGTATGLLPFGVLLMSDENPDELYHDDRSRVEKALAQNEELYHGGPGSGRFPLGSGDRPYQHRANGRVTAALKKATSKETRDKVKAATKSYIAKQKAKKEHKELVDAQKQVYKAEVDKIKAETELAKQRAKSEANARKVQAALEVLSAAYSVANHVNNISKNNEKIESVTKKNKEAEEQAKKYADVIAELRERDKYDADKASLEDAKTRAMNEAVWLNNQQKIDRNLKPQTEKVPDSNTVAEAINILSDVVKITKSGKAVFKG